MSDDDKRYLIVMTACNQAIIGAHYLNGADGATPGNKDGIGDALALLENPGLTTLAVHAAKNGYGVCPGRIDTIGGKKLLKGTHERDTLLPQYCEKIAAKPSPSSWDAFNGTGLYPRLSYDYYRLGEDCRGKRHFDCESFVAWVIVQALKKDKGVWKKSIETYHGGLVIGGKPRLDVWSVDDPDYPATHQIKHGDILIKVKPKTRHIAFVAKAGAYIVHASGKDRGVIVGGYERYNWSALARIKDAYL